MATNVWQKCDGLKHISSMDETAWRIVESQYISSTRKLVDSLEEQILLEHMIERAKPPIPQDCRDLHPLLFTPLRYPPLFHGSRFGRMHERSLWYGSLKLKTAMTELAFYRLNFLRASEAEYGVVESSHTAFCVEIKTDCAIRLFDAPFSEYTDEISSPVDYSVSQELGTAMRDSGIHAFTYKSARDPESGLNIGVFAPSCFARKQPEENLFQSWRCTADNRNVDFQRTSAIDTENATFSINMFLINGELPFPAI